MSKKISLYVKIIYIYIFFYRMTRKISGLLKNFRIAMLPCYQGFSLSVIYGLCIEAPSRKSRTTQPPSQFGFCNAVGVVFRMKIKPIPLDFPTHKPYRSEVHLLNQELLQFGPPMHCCKPTRFIWSTVRLRFRNSISGHRFQNTRKFYYNDF